MVGLLRVRRGQSGGETTLEAGYEVVVGTTQEGGYDVSHLGGRPSVTTRAREWFQH